MAKAKEGAVAAPSVAAAFTPSQLSDFLARTIPAGYPVLVEGPPGCGKSDCVDQARLRVGADLILSHPAVADPTDAKGLPWRKGEDEATFLPFGELARALKAANRTVWFLDDLGQAAPAVQASFMQLILARRVNGHVLPDCVSFIAATNRRTDKAGVTGILEPVKSRFVAIVQLVANLDEWCNWAIDKGLPSEVIAFLRFRPDLLSCFEAKADMTQSPTPRTWANLAKLISLGLPQGMEMAAYSGAVGEGAAVEFLGFLRIFRELPNIDAILIDPMASKIPEGPAALYAVTTGLASKANAKNFGRVAQYANRLTEAEKGEFAALLVRDSLRREPKVAHCPQFTELACGELGQLIGGAR